MEEMTSREIVRRCIEFRDPPRIGLHFWTDPLNGHVWKYTDFAAVDAGSDPDFSPARKGENEWGYVMETLGPTMGEVKDPPLGQGWQTLETYRFPDFSKPARYAGLKERVAAAHADGKYVYGCIPSLMLLPINLRGMENWFADQLLEPDNICLLLDHIVSIREQIIARYAEAGVDGVITWDDMGTNERVLVKPELFRRIYFPRYKRTIDNLHACSMHFIHHCCGAVQEYLPMFVEAGLDVLQLDQPQLMGIRWLSGNYGGKLCFWNPVDIQTTIPRGDLAAIEDEARHQVWAFGQYGGGFMVKAYQQPNAIGMTVRQAEAQYEAFLKYSRYPLQPYMQETRSAD